LGATIGVMPDGAPRLPLPLIDALERLDDPRRPIAETWRRLCVAADELGVSRPSYEHTRRLVRDVRRRAALPGSADLLLDVTLRMRSPLGALDEHTRRSDERRLAERAHRDAHAWRRSEPDAAVPEPPPS
jgi:hypothetical protein